MDKAGNSSRVLAYIVMCLLLGYSVSAQSVRMSRLAAIPTLTPRVVGARIPNSIDSLRTNADVEQWVRKHAVWRKRSYFYPAFQLDTALITYSSDCQQYCTALSVKPWSIADLDGNGRSDLIAFRLIESFGRFLHEPYIFYDYGLKDGIRTQYLQGRGAGPCELVSTTQLNGRPALIFAHHVTPPQSDGFSLPLVLQIDTLVYRFGDLVEYNASPPAPRFGRLEVNFGAGCCASFSITVHADRKLEYQVKSTNGSDYYFSNKERGKFQSELDSEQFEQLQQLFQYIKPEKLASTYAVNWTDAGTAWLTAEYGNGKVVHVKDYGERATWGVSRLYELVARLRTHQRWYSVEHPYDVPVR